MRAQALRPYRIKRNSGNHGRENAIAFWDGVKGDRFLGVVRAIANFQIDCLCSTFARIQ